jgi:hypothetical protein
MAFAAEVTEGETTNLRGGDMQTHRDEGHTGSFAEGEETLPEDEHTGSFAEGEETLPEDEHTGSFADEEGEAAD